MGIKATLNWGLSPKFKESFPSVKPVNRPKVENIKIKNLNWIRGFIEAEGCFSVKKTKNNHSFSIGQKNDKYILESIKEHFNISNQIRQINNNFWFVEVYKKSVLTNIINHLNNYPLLGEKQLSFKKFKDLFK